MDKQKFKNKKLLILGGISHMIDVVTTAKNMGIYTIVVDYDKYSPAKRLSDKSYTVSTTDIDSLVSIAKKEKIDGVFTGFEDTNTYTALQLTKELNLPFYATEEQLNITSDKQKFKRLCEEFNIPIVKTYAVNGDFIENIHQYDIEFPIIIKPVDSYGSRGITVCYNLEECKDAIENAKKYSKSKEFTIEHFYTNHGVEMYYTVQKGEIILSAMSDRYIYQTDKNSPPLPIATVYPSYFLDTYLSSLDDRVRNMISKLDIKNGVISIQAIVDQTEFYIYEMSFRLTGEKHYQIVKENTGVNLLEMMIELALLNEFSLYDVGQDKLDAITKPSSNLSYLIKPGKISSIDGLEEINRIPEVIDYIQLQYEGDTISKVGDYSQMLIRINIVAKDKSHLYNTIDRINQLVQVKDVFGDDMMLPQFTHEISWDA